MNKKMKKITEKAKRKILGSLIVTSFLVPMPVFAAGNPVSGIGKMKELFSSIVSAIGAVILIWSIFQLGMALKQRDNAAVPGALAGIAGGLIIAFAPWVVTYIAG